MESDESFVWLCLSEYKGNARLFVRYASARRKQYNEELVFRMYVTDGIKALIECWGGEVRHRYLDIIAVKKEETRTADEIIETISDKLSLLGGE